MSQAYVREKIGPIQGMVLYCRLVGYRGRKASLGSLLHAWDPDGQSRQRSFSCFTNITVHYVWREGFAVATFVFICFIYRENVEEGSLLYWREKLLKWVTFRKQCKGIFSCISFFKKGSKYLIEVFLMPLPEQEKKKEGFNHREIIEFLNFYNMGTHNFSERQN